MAVAVAVATAVIHKDHLVEDHLVEDHLHEDHLVKNQPSS